MSHMARIDDAAIFSRELRLPLKHLGPLLDSLSVNKRPPLELVIALEPTIQDVRPTNEAEWREVVGRIKQMPGRKVPDLVLVELTSHIAWPGWSLAMRRELRQALAKVSQDRGVRVAELVLVTVERAPRDEIIREAAGVLSDGLHVDRSGAVMGLMEARLQSGSGFGERVAILRALGEAADPRTRESRRGLLLAGLSDHDAGIREAAVLALGELGDQAARQPLLEALAQEREASVVDVLHDVLDEMPGA